MIEKYKKEETFSIHWITENGTHTSKYFDDFAKLQQLFIQVEKNEKNKRIVIRKHQILSKWRFNAGEW